MGYRYFQTDEHGPWKTAVDDNKFFENFKTAGGVRYTILSTSHDLNTEEVDIDDVKYIGPLYFDIDEKDINVAIESTRDLVRKLMQLDVVEEGIEVYCSGQKGFHVIVPQSQFLSSNRMVKHLPSAYMEMAMDLYVMGMDFAIYSSGKGRMFRPENGHKISSEDNITKLHRVRISHDELFSIKTEAYAQLVLHPREQAFPALNGHKAAPLAAVYERARRRAVKKQSDRASAVKVDALIPFAEDPPPCVDAVVKDPPARGSTFNQIGFQLASFIARAGVPEYKRESLISQLSDHGDSKSYDTPQKRKTHLKGLVYYAMAKPSVFFSCAAMRSVIQKNPCRDCPLDNQRIESSLQEEDQQIKTRPDGYYLATDKTDRKLSNFVFRVVETHMDHSVSGSASRRTGTVFDIFSNHDLVASSVQFDEMGWRSRSEFLKQLEGVPTIGFIGTDIDIQRIKVAVYLGHEEDEVEEVTNVYAAGIYESKAGSKKLYTYVEPGLSVNTYGIKGTHRLQGRTDPPPEVRISEPLQMNDERLASALKGLMSINSPEVMAHLIGWHAACHLKVHVMNHYRQFPSLNTWGTAGSGKSMTTQVMGFLNCVNYQEHPPISVSLATAYPIIERVSSTTSIPVIFEEFNKRQIKKFGMYELLTECIKAGFNGNSIPRGSLSRSRANGSSRTGAQVENFYVSAPLLICSEEPPTHPALQQRMVQVQLTTSSRKGKSTAYYSVLGKTEKLKSFGRAMTMTALKTRPDWVTSRVEEGLKYVPKSFIDRPRLSYALIFMGLDYFHGVAHSLGVDINQEMGKLRLALAQHLQDNAEAISASKRWSTVDQVLAGIGEMAQLAVQNSEVSPLILGKHWLLKEPQGQIIIDMRIVFTLYKKYSRSVAGENVFTEFSQMAPLLKAEPYYLTDDRVEQLMAGDRKVWVFSTEEMKKKGHDISMFK